MRLGGYYSPAGLWDSYTRSHRWVSSKLQRRWAYIHQHNRVLWLQRRCSELTRATQEEGWHQFGGICPNLPEVTCSREQGGKVFKSFPLVLSVKPSGTATPQEGSASAGISSISPSSERLPLVPIHILPVHKAFTRERCFCGKQP